MSTMKTQGYDFLMLVLLIRILTQLQDGVLTYPNLA